MANLRVELKTDLEAAGLFDHRPWLVYGKAVWLLAVMGAFFAAFVAVDSWWLKVPLYLAGVVTSIGFVMVGHDSGHGAVSRNRFVNDFIGFFAFPLFGGLSFTYWRYKHNTLHHSYVNVDGKDPDIRIYPFAMHTKQKAESGFQAAVQKKQALLFWPLTLFAALAMRYDGIKFLLVQKKVVASKLDLAIDWFCVIAHYALWVGVPVALGFPFLGGLAFYVVWAVLIGPLLAAIFLPAHMTLPLYADYDDNFVLQLYATQNLETNPLFSFLLIGLDHQVEHHLFQRMSHTRLKDAAPIVQAFCKRHDLPYHSQGWGAAIRDSTLRMDELPDYELTPLPPKFESGPQAKVA